MKGMTIEAVARACNGVFYGDSRRLESVISNVTTDSRKAENGSLFVAIKGERSDGHDYIESVFEKGALCCISEKILEIETGNIAYIKVDSSLQALKDIAEYYRSVLDVKVIGITGSVGKTSTKETVAAVLSQKYKTLKTLGNFNNEIGLPLTIFRLTEEDEAAVLEMGISDFGEMTRLSKIAKPDICIITNIGLCHLENLITRDGILKAKTEIFTHMNRNGTVILNGDDDKLVTVTEVNGKSPVLFGIDNKSDIYADQINNLGLDGMRCQIHFPQGDGQESFEVQIPVAGYHMVYNALAASAAGQIMGLTSDEIKAGIESLETIAGRNHIIRQNGFTVIDDCYNANPVSMKASIDVLDTALGRKVCILGDMFELGEHERQLHYEVGIHLAGKKIDILLTAGSLSEEIAKGAQEYVSNNQDAHNCEIIHFTTRDEMMNALESILVDGDNILVKASHGMEFTKVVEKIVKL